MFYYFDNIIKHIMKLLNKILITIGCTFFSIHFGFLIAILAICYFTKSVYYKITKKGHFKINPFGHANPEVLMPTMAVITLQGFRIDSYSFLTVDNCTLTVWRVVNLTNPITKPHPIFLQHGLLDCSVSWFLQKDKNNALPYVLSRMGFDVWIGNNRGTKYSNLEQHRDGYWDYTFDELAKYDVPTFIDGILGQTNSEKIIYIGHSQGSSQFLAHLSEQDESISHKIQAFIALGPVISLKDVKDHPVINLASKAPLLEFYSLLGFKTFLHLPSWLSKSVGVLMYNFKFYADILLGVVNILCGYPENNKIDLDRFGIMIAHEPGGASINNLKHWIQQTKTQQFSKFNYGTKKNQIIYGCDQPPSYNFNKLKQYQFNKYIFRGSKDAVISQNDFNLLLSKLDSGSTFHCSLTDYAHLDYLWGVCARQVLYEDILKISIKQSSAHL